MSPVEWKVFERLSSLLLFSLFLFLFSVCDCFCSDAFAGDALEEFCRDKKPSNSRPDNLRTPLLRIEAVFDKESFCPLTEPFACVFLPPTEMADSIELDEIELLSERP